MSWTVAKKAKAGAGAILGVVAVVMIPIKFVAWAEDQTAEQIKEAAFVAEGREQVIHSAAQAKHDYDFYSIRAEQAEQELISLEEDLDAGEELTATEQRKMDKLVKRLDDFEERQEQALEQLSNPEHDDEEEEN